MSKLNAQKYDLDTAFAAFGPVGHSLTGARGADRAARVTGAAADLSART